MFTFPFNFVVFEFGVFAYFTVEFHKFHKLISILNLLLSKSNICNLVFGIHLCWNLASGSSFKINVFRVVKESGEVGPQISFQNIFFLTKLCIAWQVLNSYSKIIHFNSLTFKLLNVLFLSFVKDIDKYHKTKNNHQVNNDHKNSKTFFFHVKVEVRDRYFF